MKIKSAYLFVIILLGVAFYYNYWDILHKRPQSIHRWRQADCASIALNYYQHGMKFFHPETHYQISDGGTSGFAVGECPILYYGIAFLWKIFGYSDFIYRLVNTLIFFLGLLALFRLLRQVLKDDFWAISISLIFFTSPVVVYYAANYITDVTAFSLTLIGWSFFFKYYIENSQRAFYWAMAMFALAGLLKVTALMSVIALLGVFILETVGVKIFSKTKHAFQLNFKKSSAFILVFLIVASWYVYASYYNQLHHAFTNKGIPFFSTQTFPIWGLKQEAIIDILKEIKNHWLAEYYNITVIIFFLLSIAIMLFRIKKQNQFLVAISLALFAGVFSVSILWFYAFGQHDYYIVNLLIFPLFVIITLFEYFMREYKIFFNSILSKVIFAIFILFNIHYAKMKLNERYDGWVNDYSVNKDIHTITPYLRKVGIQASDKIICLPDPTPNYTLYLMNQPGWTNFSFFEQDTVPIKKYIELGAKYLIITEPEPLSRPYLMPFITKKVGEYGSVSVFKL